MNPNLSRRELRSAAAATAAAQPKRGSQAKRTLITSLGVLAAVGFVAAYLVPTTVALADTPAQQTENRPLSAYEASVNGAQSLIVADGASTSELSRGNYETYVTPAPEPEPVAEDSSSGGGYVASAPPAYTGGGSPQEWMSAAGIAEGDWGYVDYIVSRESGWNPNATNSSSGACGLVQALPCSKVGGAGGYDPVSNLQWANGYAVGRYGSWANAYAFWTSNHWW